jgi:Fur family zinc uptake transcriptional regulator
MPDRRFAKAFPAPEHDHDRCLEQTWRRADARFEAKSMRLTPLRKRVLQEIANSHHAVGAYEVLDKLARKTGTRPAPISVYRAIDALLEAGVVHRLESRNAFFACHTPHAGHARQIILVCEQCGIVAEVPCEQVFEGIEVVAGSTGFSPTRAVVEVAGACGQCSAAAAQ